MKKKLLSIVLIISILLSTTYILGASLVLAEGASSYHGNFQGGGFENEEDLSLWTVGGKTDQTVAIDSSNGYNGSGSALAITMPTAYYTSGSVLNLRGKTVTGAEQSFDTNAQYYAEMYIKTSADFNGSVYLRLRQNSKYVQIGGNSDLTLLGAKDTGVSGTQSYIRIKTAEFTLTKHSIQMLL